MDERDQKWIAQRYQERYQKYGYDPKTLGWGKGGRQDIRFAALTAEALKGREGSVLDVGCGFADLYAYLKTRGWAGKYTGVDITPELIDVAQERHPEATFLCGDIQSDNCSLEPHDYVVTAGIFNTHLKHGKNETFIMEMLATLFQLTGKVLAVDFMSSYVDFEAEGSWHTNPAWAFEAGRNLSKRVSIRHDYMPYEFALFVYKEDSVDEQNLFESDS